MGGEPLSTSGQSSSISSSSRNEQQQLPPPPYQNFLYHTLPVSSNNNGSSKTSQKKEATSVRALAAPVDRNVTITVTNWLNQAVTGGTLKITHGVLQLPSPPPVNLLVQQSIVFDCNNKAGSSHGPQGTLYYTCFFPNDIEISWDHKLGQGLSAYTVKVPAGMHGVVGPTLPFGHQQSVCFTLSMTPAPFEHWMEDMKGILGPRTLMDLTLPGSHDSGTFFLGDQVYFAL